MRPTTIHHESVDKPLSLVDENMVLLDKPAADIVLAKEE